MQEHTITADPQFTIHVIGPDDKVIMVVPKDTTPVEAERFLGQFEALLGPHRAQIVVQP